MLRPYAFSTHAWFVVNAVCGVVAVPFALTTLRLGVLGVGLALSATGVGSLLGSLVVVRLGRVLGVGGVDVLAYAGNGVAWALIAVAPPRLSGWLLFGFGQFLFGAGLGISNALSSSYRQAATPDALRVRMGTTIRSVNRAMFVIGAPIGGFLAEAVGDRVVLLAAAAGFAVIALAIIPTPFRHARLGDAFTPDAA